MFSQNKESILRIPITNKKNKSSLSELNSLLRLSAAIIHKAKHGYITLFERTALSASDYLKGSLTVEASVVLPVFLFLSICLVFFCQVFMIHSEIQGSLFLAARHLSGNVIPIEYAVNEELANQETLQKVLCIAVAKQKVEEYSGDILDESVCLVNGKAGLSYYYSAMEDEYVDLVVNYRVQLPFAFGLRASFPVVQRCRIRAWTGLSGSKKISEEMVYVTNNASVYHLNEQCTHLKLTIYRISSLELSTAGNVYGNKYTACGSCVKNNAASGMVYVTEDGDRYHNRLDCGGLKRYVQQIPKSQAEGMKPCSRCGS